LVDSQVQSEKVKQEKVQAEATRSLKRISGMNPVQIDTQLLLSEIGRVQPSAGGGQGVQSSVN